MGLERWLRIQECLMLFQSSAQHVLLTSAPGDPACSSGFHRNLHPHMYIPTLTPHLCTLKNRLAPFFSFKRQSWELAVPFTTQRVPFLYLVPQHPAGANTSLYPAGTPHCAHCTQQELIVPSGPHRSNLLSPVGMP